MLGFLRRNEGFDWVSYVPTQVLARRKARRARIKQAAGDVKDAAARAAAKSADAVGQGIVQAGALAQAGAAGAMSGVQAHWRSTLRRIIRSSVDVGQLASARGVGIAGIVLLVTGIALALLHVETPAAIALASGAVLIVATPVPFLWRLLAPSAARLALEALKTRRVVPGDVSPVAAARRVSMPQALGLAGLAIAAVGIVGGLGWGIAAGYRALTGTAAGLAGTAAIVAPDILRLGGEEVRLAGIAAPEGEQSCTEGGRRRCREEARRALFRAVSGKSVSCRVVGMDDAGRRTGQCHAGGVDLARDLVRAGHVWADENDTMGYRALEKEAREAKAGLWKGSAQPPWVWRSRLWEEAQRAAPDGCPIKADSAGGRLVYLLPWSPDYGRLRITKSESQRGVRRWFCTEAEAQSAGYVLGTLRGSRRASDGSE